MESITPMAKYLLLRSWLVFLKTSARCGLPIFLKVNHRLESRMQEISPVRFGGRGKAHLCPYPYLSPGFQPVSTLGNIQ